MSELTCNKPEPMDCPKWQRFENGCPDCNMKYVHPDSQTCISCKKNFVESVDDVEGYYSEKYGGHICWICYDDPRTEYDEPNY